MGAAMKSLLLPARVHRALRSVALASAALLTAGLPGQWPLALGLALVAAPAGLAAQPTARDTDALRRVQRALQLAQQERDAARAEAASLQREQQVQARALQASQADAARAQGELRQLQALLAQGQQQASQQQQALAQAAEEAIRAAQAQEAAQAQWGRERGSLQRELQGLRQTNETLVARLAGSIREQADLQRRNQALHALGLELLDLYRGADAAQAWGPAGVLGLAAVRREDRAEQARVRLDALRRAPLPPATAP